MGGWEKTLRGNLGRSHWEVGRKPYEITSGDYIGRLGEFLYDWEKTLRGNLGRLHWEVGRNPCEVTSADYIKRLGENLVR